jgi:4-hydroxyproline epimerase
MAGVIFFNNAGYLGMCGHGTIGVVETLKHLGRLQPGPVSLDTPVGTVTATLEVSGEVVLRNVRSYVHRTDVVLDVEGLGKIRGDVAYGGNWFFLVHAPTFDIPIEKAKVLTEISLEIKRTLAANHVCGADGAEIDHIELSGPALAPEANSRNFVLCPGGAYDRSPCGTGTSAKLAALFACGELAGGEVYVQESIAGGIFKGSVEPVDGGVIPTITGRAHIVADSTLYFSENDPLRWGLV